MHRMQEDRSLPPFHPLEGFKASRPADARPAAAPAAFALLCWLRALLAIPPGRVCVPCSSPQPASCLHWHDKHSYARARGCQITGGGHSGLNYSDGLRRKRSPSHVGHGDTAPVQLGRRRGGSSYGSAAAFRNQRPPGWPADPAAGTAPRG